MIQKNPISNQCCSFDLSINKRIMKQCLKNIINVFNIDFSNLLLSNFVEPVWIVASVSCSMCCVFFRDGILYTLVVMSGYLSYCCLSIISNQSANSPLTSDNQQGIFVHTTAAHWIFSIFPTTLYINSRDGCVWKVDRSFWNTQTSPSGTNNHSTFKVT